MICVFQLVNNVVKSFKHSYEILSLVCPVYMALGQAVDFGILPNKICRNLRRSLCVSLVLVTLTSVRPDIDHLTRILFLCGKPDQETIDKITSEEVRNYILPAH